MLAKTWLQNARSVVDKIENTQMGNIHSAAKMMADTIEAGRWVHILGCGHATLPIEEIYPRIRGFVRFHPMIEPPFHFFSNNFGGMSVPNFVLFEMVERYGTPCLQGYQL